MLFSIVVPVFNREKLIRRCIASVAAQDFADYELILVDDCSTDNSLAVLRQAEAANVTVVALARNEGVGGARNAGVAAASGEWIVFLDSDDELVPGALAILRDRVRRVPDTVEGLWFRARMDDGRAIPPHLTQPQEWDYPAFLAFWNQSARDWHDMLYCNRRRSFAHLPQPAGRMDDIKYLLDFGKRFRIRAFPEVLRLYHQDAANQLVVMTRRLDPWRDRETVTARADEVRNLLKEHGQALAQLAPDLYDEHLEAASTTATMAGRRAEAIVFSWRLALRSPLRRRNWILLAAAFIGPPAVRLRRWATSA